MKFIIGVVLLMHVDVHMRARACSYDDSSVDVDVLVLGAGMAGVKAAATLAEANIRCEYDGGYGCAASQV